MRNLKPTSAAIAALFVFLVTTVAHAGRPVISRSTVDFDLPLVDCGTFTVWTRGTEHDTEKMWFDKDGNPVRLVVSIKIASGEYYNGSAPENSLVQGDHGVGENATIRIDLTNGDVHSSGAFYRLTLPGIGHVLLDVGSLFWDASEMTLTRNGPDFVLADGDTAPALCEALQ